MMDQEQLVEAVRAATEDVFSTMLGLPVASRDPYVEINAPGPSEGIIAVIGLAGTWVGTASICCNASMACRMSSQMLGTEFGSVNADVLDAMSEIANMIIGSFKTTAELYLGPLGLSIPTVIYGLSFSARSSAKERWTVVPFTCGEDSIDVKICLAPNRGLPGGATLSGRMP